MRTITKFWIWFGIMAIWTEEELLSTIFYVLTLLGWLADIITE